MATQGTRPPERGVRLFLGNLSYDVTEAHISQALQGCGGVLYVNIRRAPDTQRSRGYGQVEFATEEDALRALERLRGLEIKGRSVRVDWCEQSLRRKYPLTANPLGGSGGPQREATSQGGHPTTELFDSQGCLTPAALAAAEGVTLGDLEQLLDELRLLLPSTGSLLQQLLHESPLLRAALLQAQLLLGRHDLIDLPIGNAAVLKRTEAAATQRLLLECCALRPPELPVLTVTPPPQASVKPITSASSRQRKQEMARPPVTWRPSAPARPAPLSDAGIAINAASGVPVWRVSPAPDALVTGGPPLTLSPVTPAPPTSVYSDGTEGKGETGGFCTSASSQKRKREGEELQQSTNNPEGCTPEEAKRPWLALNTPSNASLNACPSAWLAAEEAKVGQAPDSLVDELLRSQGLLEKVVGMTAAELMQLDPQQRQQLMALRKALRAHGKLPASAG